TYEHETTYTVVELQIFEDGDAETDSYDSNNESEVDVDENFDEGDSKVVKITNADDGTPRMPKIKFVFEPSNSIDYKMKLKLVIRYNVDRPTGSDLDGDNEIDDKERNDSDSFPDTNNDATDEEWEVLEVDDNKEWVVDNTVYNDYFCGGEATLYWEVIEEDNDGNESTVTEGEYVFYIRGESPDDFDEDVAPYVSDDRWYYEPIVRHECAGYGQFNTIEVPYNHYGSDQEGTADEYDDFEGCPNYGAPDGWGYMQLEQAARANYVDDLDTGEDGRRGQQLLWNWQDNIDAGVEWVEQKRDGAEDYLNRQMQLAGGSDSAPEIDMEDFPDEFDWWYDVEDEDGDTITISDTHRPDYEDVTFEDSRRQFHPDAEFTILDAITIKRYNGASRPESDTRGNPPNGNFIEWDVENREWICHPLNILEPPNNYVEDICVEYSENN
ncbi:MAG: hypothetical protein ACOCZ5_03720, partial [bacterium]